MNNKTRFSLLPGLIIFVVGITAYWNSFHVPFQFDDYGYAVLENRKLTGFSTIKDLWLFYPARFIGLLSFAFNLNISGKNVFGFHLINFSIHLITSILTYYLTRTILWLTLVPLPEIKGNTLTHNPKKLDYNPGKSIDLIALMASLIFVSHPLNTAVVTYITQRFTGLCAMFYLGSLVCYIKYCIHRSYGNLSKNRFIAGAFLLAVLANYTKENAATIAATWFLVEILLFNLSLENAKSRKTAILSCGFMLLLPFITLLLGNNIASHVVTSADAPSWNHYLITQTSVILSYLRLFFWPVSLNLDYDYPLFTSIFYFEILIKLLVHGVLLLIAYKTRQKWKGVSFGILFFYIALLPDSSVVPMPEIMIEHRIYLPSVGIIICLASAILRPIALQYHFTTFFKKELYLICFIVIVLIFTLDTHRRNEVWKSPETLWLDVIKKSPGELRGYLQLGKYYLNDHQYEKSIKYYRTATEIDPSFSGSYNNIGIAYVKKGDVDNSIKLFNQALLKDSKNETYYRNLGHAYQVGGYFEKAVETLRSCVAKYPEYSACYLRLAKVYRENKDYNSAIELLTTIIKTKINLYEIYMELALSLKYSGDKEACKKALRKSLLLNPGSLKAKKLLNELENTGKKQ